MFSFPFLVSFSSFPSPHFLSSIRLLSISFPSLLLCSILTTSSVTHSARGRFRAPAAAGSRYHAPSVIVRRACGLEIHLAGPRTARCVRSRSPPHSSFAYDMRCDYQRRRLPQPICSSTTPRAAHPMVTKPRRASTTCCTTMALRRCCVRALYHLRRRTFRPHAPTLEACCFSK